MKDNQWIEVNDLLMPFPKPQLQELLNRIEQGDEAALKVITEHNIRIVIYEVNQKFKFVEYDKKDLVSIGTIGLIKAIITFNPSKQNRFTTHAVSCIDNQILIFLRKLKKDQKVSSLDQPIRYDENGESIKIKDTLFSPINIMEDDEKEVTYKIIREIVKELPDRDREIIMLYFGFYDDKPYMQKEIAKKTSLNQSSVSKIIKENIKKLGKQLQQEGLIELRKTPSKKRTKQK